MPEKCLIVNADDYGLTRKVSEGIRVAHRQGIVTSTTAMMNVPGVESDLTLAKAQTPKLAIGTHLNLTTGQPLLSLDKVPSLVNTNGHFHSLAEIRSKAEFLDPNQVYDEWSAQIAAMIACNVYPDHLDSHHHISYKHPTLFQVMQYLASEHDLPIRSASVYTPTMSATSQTFQKQHHSEELFVRTTDALLTKFFAGKASLEVLQEILTSLTEAVTELMVHPGYNDASLALLSSYREARETELAILTSNLILELVRSNNIHLTTYTHLLCI